MKKIIYIFLVFSLTLALASCNKDEGVDYGTHTFENKTIQTSLEIQEKIDFYILEIEDIIEKEENYDSNMNPGTYQRDELPESVPYNQNILGNMPYQEIKFLLQIYNGMLKDNDFFEEDAYNDYDNLGYQTKLKIRLEDNQFYIQAFDYRIKNSYGDKSVDETVMYFNVIDDNLYFDFAKDRHAIYATDSPIAESDNGNQMKYYNFIENGDKTHIFIDNFYDDRYGYDIQTINRRQKLMFYRFGDSFRVKFSNAEYDKLYHYFIGSIDDNESIESTVTYISDTEGLQFKESGNGVYRMDYNLLEVQGWNKVTDQPDKIFNDDQALFDDLNVYVSINTFAYIRVETTAHKDDFSADDLNLSKYGLSYDLKSYDQVLDDIEYVKENYMDALNDYSLENDPTKDKALLLSKVPFEFDSEMIDELFDILEQS